MKTNTNTELQEYVNTVLGIVAPKDPDNSWQKDQLEAMMNAIDQYVHQKTIEARIEGAVMGARFGNAVFRQQNIADPTKPINLDELLREGVRQATQWAEGKL